MGAFEYRTLAPAIHRRLTTPFGGFSKYAADFEGRRRRRMDRKEDRVAGTRHRGHANGCDVVAGLDAMGFVLGSALAARIGVGFLPIRKTGKLCVDTDSVSFSNYSGRTQDMEMRQPAFAVGTKVLLVDQWIETGGTMDGAIRLVERQAGEVVGLVAIAMEENDKTANYRQRFACVTAVRPGSDLQQQCNRQSLDSFAHYTPELAFPKIRTR